MNIGIVILVIAVVIAVWIIGVYNFFVSSKARIKASIQEIGNQLKRQSNLIPNLENSAKGFLKHEKAIFTKLTDARKAVDRAVNSGDVTQMGNAGSKLSEILPKIQVLVESNPELKGDKVVTKLMDELRDTTDKVMYSRRLLIDLTADYNVKRVTFPTNIIANAFKFDEMKGLDTPQTGEHVSVSKTETKSPKINL
ncbi:LemA family protein [Candidatus Microgenomates bacterium]|nr:LemA family protein [Candidatus Microgenomates bacterium]